MQDSKSAPQNERWSPTMLLVAAGLVFGDIGTSPLYTFPAALRGQANTEMIALGVFSAVFWTLTMQTTLKYVVLTMQADNRGEGGIFSLYTLVRRYRKWFIVPAIFGGAFLLADGIITPPISVTSAVEGQLIYYPDLNTLPIVILILLALFWAQQLGSQNLGTTFGAVMAVWFTFIGIVGVMAIIQEPRILSAINPVYALNMLLQHPGGFWLLGGVFLCTTGAEALYSDMGHVGRSNIRISWAYIKVCLLSSYAGQAAWLLGKPGYAVSELTPFFAIVPEAMRPVAIVLSTLATIIASQALISGSFTLVGEAMRLGLWPRSRIVYPTDFRGQLYIPSVNWLLASGCVAVVFHFRTSAQMEAAFGLSVTLTMLMSTILLLAYLYTRHMSIIWIGTMAILFFSLELSFLVANLKKFKEGGYISLLIGTVLVGLMFVWFRARHLKRAMTDLQPMGDNLHLIKRLSIDKEVPRLTTNLIYLTASPNPAMAERRIFHSIFSRGPKRADLYWFIHIETLDEPFGMKYSVKKLAGDGVIWVIFYLGFRIEPRVNVLFRRVVEEMVAKGEVNILSPYPSLGAEGHAGDFRFILFESFLSHETDLPGFDRVVMNTYYAIKNLSQSDSAAYGLDTSQVSVEKVPLLPNFSPWMRLERINPH